MEIYNIDFSVEYKETISTITKADKNAKHKKGVVLAQ
jgi:hypothetical protein